MTECERLIEQGKVEASFLQEEVREQYTVSVKMKKVWTIELDLLNQFDAICKEHNLRYWAGFGTLLGAVRHKGFIPWDDDMDVWMPREDYDKLLALDLKLDSPYFLQTTLNDDDYYSSFARLRNSNTTGVLVSRNNKCNNGIYIDIYPLDGLNRNDFFQWIRSKYIRVKNVVAHAYMYNINPHAITRTLHTFLRLPFVPYNPLRTYKKINKIASNMKWERADKVGFVVFAPYAHSRNIFDKKDFDSTEWINFENTKVPVPSGYRNVLSVLYGNYMSFPPVEKRGIWHNFTFEPDIPYDVYLKNSN